MIDVKVKIDFKKTKFRQSIQRGERRFLYYCGAAVRGEARKLLKPAPKDPKSDYGIYRTIKRGKRAGQRQFVRGRYSRPGMPPYVRSANGGLRNIEFRVNRTNTAVQIGPVVRSNRSTAKPGPRLLEFGGTSRIRYKRRRKRGGYSRRTEIGRWTPHPFMGPALKKAVDRAVPAFLKKHGILG